MQTIKIPIDKVFVTGTDVLSLKDYVDNIVNKVLVDMSAHILRMGHSDLSAFFNSLSVLFKKLSLLFKLLKHRRAAIGHRLLRAAVNNGNMSYIQTADSLAYSFSAIKSEIQPSFDIESALAFHLNYRLLFPQALSLVDSTDDFSEISKLIRIYLLKEDLSNYECITSDDGILTIKSKYFVYKLTLCGDIENPMWRVLDVNRENKLPYTTYLFPDLKKLISFTDAYTASKCVEEIYTKLKSSNVLSGSLRGTSTNIILDYVCSLHVFIRNGRVVSVARYKTCKEYYDRQVLENYENFVKSTLRSIDNRLNFTLSDGICMTVEKHNSREEDGEKRAMTIRFNSIFEVSEFLFKEKKDEKFYGIFKEYGYISDCHKKIFGKRNAFIRRGSRFLAAELRADGDLIVVCLYVGDIIDRDVISYRELRVSCVDATIVAGTEIECGPVKPDDFGRFIKLNYDNLWYVYDIVNCELVTGILIGESVVISRKDKKMNFERLGSHFIFNGYTIDNIGRIKEFMVFLSVVDGLNQYRIGCTSNALGTAGDALPNLIETDRLNTASAPAKISFAYNDLSFDLDFKDTIEVYSGNKSLEKVAKCELFHQMLKCFYLVWTYCIIPSYVSGEYIIFNLHNTLNDSIVLKYRDNTSFFVLKNRISRSYFKLESFDTFYFFGNSGDSSFFKEIRTLVLRERFAVLGNRLSKDFQSRFVDAEISLTHKHNMLFMLRGDSFIVKSDGMTESVTCDLTNIFYKEDDFAEKFVQTIRKL